MKFTQRASRLVAVPAALMVALGALLPAPAQADVWYDGDGNNPAMPSGDISRIRLDHAPRTVATKVRFHDGGYGDRLRVYYDTLPRDGGPEFVLDVTLIAEGEVVDRWQLQRIDSFRQGQRGKGELVRCREDRVSLTAQAGIYTEMPRRCLASQGSPPRKVRVSVWSWAYDHGPAGESWHDWAPGSKRFGRWVQRG